MRPDHHDFFFVVDVFDPLCRCWRFVCLDGLAVGLSVPVLKFNTYPAFIVAIGHRWLAIMAINFFDDFKITNTQKGIDSAVYCLRRLAF